MFLGAEVKGPMHADADQAQATPKQDSALVLKPALWKRLVGEVIGTSFLISWGVRSACPYLVQP